MQAAQRVAFNTGILYVRMAITVFISLYSTRLILGALGINDFGIFNLVGGIITMLTFLNSAMTAATQRYLSYAQGAGDINRSKTIFNVSLVLHIGIAIVLLIFLEAAGYFLFRDVIKIPVVRLDAAKIIYQSMIVSTLFTIIIVPYDAAINSHENMLFYAIVGIIEAVSKLLIAIYLIHTSFDKLVTYGFGMAGISIFVSFLRWLYCHRNYVECQLNLRKNFSKTIFNEMAQFAGWSFLASSSSMIAAYGQGIVMNVFFGTAVNAAQGIATQVSGQFGAFAITMMKALNPLIAKSAGAGDRSLMIRATIMGSKVSFFLLMMLYIPVLIEMPFIFKIWLKNVPEYAIIFCRLYLIRCLIDQMFVTLSSSISAVGNIKKYQLIVSVLNILPLVASWFLFKLGFPPYALYIAFIIYSLSMAIAILYFSKINYGLSLIVFYKEVFQRCVISFLLVYLVSYIPRIFISEGLIRLTGVLFASLVSFVFIVWFAGFSSSERASFLGILKLSVHKVRSRYYK